MKLASAFRVLLLICISACLPGCEMSCSDRRPQPREKEKVIIVSPKVEVPHKR